jgi:nucleoid-associated protein YgaU
MAKYSNKVQVIRTDEGVRYYSSAIPVDTIYDDIPFQYVSRMGDRWDKLAAKYLGSAALWHVIAAANNLANGSIFIPIGTVVTIPQQT